MARNRTAAFIAAGAGALLILELFLGAKIHLFFGDFRAFYCAGSAIVHGADPYAAASLYPCERADAPFGLYRALPGIAVPAPFPAYALLGFVPFGALPYLAACTAWLLLLIATSLACVFSFAKLTGVPRSGALAVLACGFGVLVIPYGELATVAMCALLGMALALRRGAWNAAALWGAVLAIIPHVGVPALLGVFLWQREMRVRLAIVAAVLTACDIAAAGMHSAVQYFTLVLPAHALSEVGSTSQYGLTWMLHALGASDAAAIKFGELSFACMLAAGIATAGVLVRRTQDAAYAALVPAAFVVLGGSFMHYTEIMLALPAAALLLRQTHGTLRAVFAAALLLIALPWAWALSQPILVVAFAAFGAAIASRACGLRAQTALRIALGCALLGTAVVAAGSHFGTGLAHGVSAHVDGSLAQASWAQYVRTQRSSIGPVWWIAKAPTWIGLALLTLGGVYLAAQKDLVTPVAIEQTPVGA